MEAEMGNQIKLIVFVILTLGIAWLSRRSLREFKSHGFYRFFAWELILGLVLINMDFWFFEPFSWHQLISWPLLLISLYLIVHAVVLLRRVGGAETRQSELALIGIEKTSQLVTVGPYRYIRHPFYSSLLFLALGAFFKQLSWLGGLLIALAVIMLVATAKTEEAENIAYFGEEYRAYMGQTKMFMPFIF
jgi:protein-S-isoprenylcysteine O-methyltransferase Ste14